MLQIWKEHLEEKDERRRKSREKAARRKTMGYDEFDDSWKTRMGSSDNSYDDRRQQDDGDDSWGFGDSSSSKRRRGTRDGFIDGADQWDFGGGQSGAREQQDAGTSAAEMDFLEKLMKDLDNPTAGLSASPTPRDTRSTAPAMAGRQQGGWGRQDDEEDDADMQQLRGMKRQSGAEGGVGGRRASQATLTKEEQDEFDRSGRQGDGCWLPCRAGGLWGITRQGKV